MPMNFISVSLISVQLGDVKTDKTDSPPEPVGWVATESAAKSSGCDGGNQMLLNARSSSCHVQVLMGKRANRS